MKNFLLFTLFLCACISLYFFCDAVVADNDYNPPADQIEAILSALLTILSIALIGLVSRNFKISISKREK